MRIVDIFIGMAPLTRVGPVIGHYAKRELRKWIADHVRARHGVLTGVAGKFGVSMATVRNACTEYGVEYAFKNRQDRKRGRVSSSAKFGPDPGQTAGKAEEVGRLRDIRARAV